MNFDQLKTLLSQEPASLTWAASDDGRRTVGTAPGFVLDVWPDRVEAAAIMPPDDAALAARNGTLLQLLLAALRPDWQGSGDWLAQQLRQAARSKQIRPEFANYARGVVLVWDRLHSRVTMKVRHA